MFNFCSGHEGRAGMAAVTLREGQTFDSAAVFQHVQGSLPVYARPLFIRVQVCHIFTCRYLMYDSLNMCGLFFFTGEHRCDWYVQASEGEVNRRRLRPKSIIRPSVLSQLWREELYPTDTEYLRLCCNGKDKNLTLLDDL